MKMGSCSKWNLEIRNESLTNPFLRSEDAQKVIAAIRRRCKRVPRSTLASRLAYRIKQEEISSSPSPSQIQKGQSTDNESQLHVTPARSIPLSQSSPYTDVAGPSTYTCALQRRLDRNTTDDRWENIPSTDDRNSPLIQQRNVTEPNEYPAATCTSTTIPKGNNSPKPVPNKSQILSIKSMSAQQRQSLKENLLAAEEVACTLVFEDGTSLLRQNSNQNSKRKKQGRRARPDATAIAFPWSGSDSCFGDEINSFSPGQLAFVKITLTSTNVETADWIRDVIGQLMQSETRKICYNAQEITSWLMKICRYEPQQVCSGWIFMDVKIASWLLDPDNPPKEYCDLVEKLDMKLETKENRDNDELLRLDLSTLGPAVLTLYNRLKEKKLWELYWRLEMPLCPILAAMEVEGIQIDTKVLLHSSNVLKEKIKKLEDEAHEAAGRRFLVNSSHQLRQVLFDELKLDQKCKKTLTKTATNSYTSTSEAVLIDLQHLHPLPKIVLEYRQLVKLRSTYFDGLLPFVTNGAIHTTWEHTAAATGRLTSSNPNLQNFPKRSIQISTPKYIVGKEEKKIDIFPREAFHSREGWSFLAADFQSIELRLLAHLSNDPALLKVFNDKNSSDVFIKLTSEWLGKRREDVQFQEREQTKRMVYSVIYGVGRERLAKNIGVTVDKAKEFMKSFLDKFPGINIFTQKCIDECKKQGYVCTIFQRKRWFPNINAPQFNIRAQAERQAVNFVVQGSAADICKSSMIEVMCCFTKDSTIHARLLLQIHDELLLEVPDESISRLKDLVKSIMENSVMSYSQKSQLKVVLPVSVSTGKKWSHMSACV